VWKPRGERLQDLLALHLGQRTTKSIVRAKAKGDVPVRVSGDVEGIRCVKHVGIAVGSGDETPEAVTLPNLFAAELDRLDGDTLDRFLWRIIAQTFVDRARHRRWRLVLAKALPLFGMTEKGQEAVANEVGGGLLPCNQHDTGIGEDLIARIYPVEFATHDDPCVRRFIDEVVPRVGAGPDRYEVQMLYGVPRERLLAELRERGVRRRLYVPFAMGWPMAIAYLRRRLDEYPAMMMLVAKNMVTRG